MLIDLVNRSVSSEEKLYTGNPNTWEDGLYVSNKGGLGIIVERGKSVFFGSSYVEVDRTNVSGEYKRIKSGKIHIRSFSIQ